MDLGDQLSTRRRQPQQHLPFFILLPYLPVASFGNPARHQHKRPVTLLGQHHDPVRSRESTRDPDGSPVLYGGFSQAREVTPGNPASIATGSAAPEVKYLAVIKDGREDRRPLESHFGAWVVCTEQPGPFEVAGLDANGTVLASLPHPFQPAS